VNQTYRGRSKYRPDHPNASGSLLVAVVCKVGGREDHEIALLDTASQWCVLPPPLARELGCDLEAARDVRLHTRHGVLSGELRRFRILFVAEEGESVEVDATWFVSPDWTGPIVIGWKGCLERLRFALDPGEDNFYFAQL
jgi:hypothetical protein